jgi:hypothetical protein
LQFVARHTDALIPLVIGIVFLIDGLRRTRTGRKGAQQLMQAGGLALFVAFLTFARTSGTGTAARGGPGQIPAQPWATVSEAGWFSVMLPTGWKHSEFDEPTPHGPARTHKWTATGDAPNTYYIFRYSDAPAGASYLDPQAMFDGTAKLLAGVPGSRVTGSAPLSLAGFPGRQLDGQQGDTRLRAHVYVTPTRVYALIRTAPKDSDPAADEFFTNFSLSRR